MTDFADYCKQLTNAQVLSVVKKEDEGRKRDPDREQNYRDARDEAIRRGLLSGRHR